MQNEPKCFAKQPKVTGSARVLKVKREQARLLRQASTAAEANTWEFLRDRRLLGLKFRRQQVIIGYIVDFYCPELHLALELDGGIHEDAASVIHDNQRDQVLTRAGVHVIRIKNEAVSAAALAEVLRPYLPLPLLEPGEADLSDGAG